MLQDNGSDYEVLMRACRKVKGVPGLTCEVGLREGGGSKYMIDTLLANEDFGRTHVAIDPYGSIPYIQSETNTIGGFEGGTGPYPNEMMKYTLRDLYGYICNKDIQVLFFPFEDTVYYAMFGGGVPVYHDGKKEYVNQYACVYMDGPHNLESTMDETKFFADRSTPGSVLVYDDINTYYDHNSVREWLERQRWAELETMGTKAAYIKV